MGIGFVLGLIVPFLVGSIVVFLTGLKTGLHVSTFLKSIIHMQYAYNTYFQVGVAANIGLFFYMMKFDRLIFFSRGWLIATMLLAILTMFILMESF